MSKFCELELACARGRAGEAGEARLGGGGGGGG
eukprot:COSAG04_NODE_13944_length_586_cov_0.940452_1_plen_32_part_10